LGSATPRFAKILGSKYAQMSAESVERDLRENHGRSLSSHYVQEVFKKLGNVLRHRETMWEYSVRDLPPEAVSHIGVGLDGTTTPIVAQGYKETMAGTISFYGHDDKRLTTIYLGCAPQKEKVAFEALLAREIEVVKERFVDAVYVGLADGTPGNWTFLEPRTEFQIQDFFHVTEYLKKFADAFFTSSQKGAAWQEKYRKILRDEPQGAETILTLMKNGLLKIRTAHKREKAQSAITYFENHKHKMDYPLYKQIGLPIGSGVTEAACKTLVKQRLSQSGMKWKTENVDDMLLARGLILSQNRWEIFWNKCDRNGYFQSL
jgi:hypothetical protein